MPEIRNQKYQIDISLDIPQDHRYRPNRELNTIVTGQRVRIHYQRDTNSGTKFWYIELFGSYPLDQPESVCGCSPETTKKRQLVNVRIGYPYSQTNVPIWASVLVNTYMPEWF